MSERTPTRLFWWMECSLMFSHIQITTNHETTTQVKQPRSLTTIYGLIRPLWPYFTVTLRVTWLRITNVFLRIVYDEIRSPTGTRKWLLIIIVDVPFVERLHQYTVVYSARTPRRRHYCYQGRRNDSWVGGAQVTLSIFWGLNRLFREFLLRENDLLREFFKSWGGWSPPSPPASAAYDCYLHWIERYD